MDLHQLLNPYRHPMADVWIDNMITAFIVAVLVVIALVVLANVRGLNRAFTDERATAGNFLSAGVVLGSVLLLASLGFGAAKVDPFWFYVFAALGFLLAWDRANFTGNVIVDSLLAAVVVGLVGRLAVSGLGAIVAGQFDVGMLPVLVLLVLLGAAISKVIGWIRN